MEVMTKEESYADRRQLFKNIWDTAMQIDEKDVDNIMAKPKVIKATRNLLKNINKDLIFFPRTLRLDEMDRCVIGKRKKERIRNLRTVCKKILDFCDRQDADDILCYEQKPERKEADEAEEPPQHKLDINQKKIKQYHRRKKIRRVKSLFVPKKSSELHASTLEKKDDYPRIFPNSFRTNTPIKTKRQAFNYIVRTLDTQKKVLKANSNPNLEGSNAPVKRRSGTRRKVVRKKRKSKKSTAPDLSAPGPSGIGLARPLK